MKGWDGKLFLLKYPVERLKDIQPEASMKRLRWAAHSKGNFAGAGALYFWLVFKTKHNEKRTYP